MFGNRRRLAFPALRWPALDAGQRIRVVKGPFAGLYGHVETALGHRWSVKIDRFSAGMLLVLPSDFIEVDHEQCRRSLARSFQRPMTATGG